MRLAPLFALLGLAGLGEADGRVVRVERQLGREVFVPAGTFWMGVPGLPNNEDMAESAVQWCEAYFQSHDAQAFQTKSGGVTTFCLRYQQELAQMTEREVTVSAFAIDRDEVSVADYRRCVAAGYC